MYAFNWALTAFRSESYIGSATALPDNLSVTLLMNKNKVNTTFLDLAVPLICMVAMVQEHRPRVALYYTLLVQ